MKMDTATDFRAWANIERKIADHHLALAALYLSADMTDTADGYVQSCQDHIRTALMWERAADDLEANMAKLNK